MSATEMNVRLTILLTVADLMERTKESESAWRKRLGRKELPVVKCGSNIRIRLEDFEAWLAARTVPRQEKAS